MVVMMCCFERERERSNWIRKIREEKSVELRLLDLKGEELWSSEQASEE